MPSLRGVCQRVLPVSPDATTAELRARFDADPSLRLLPVLAEGRVVGLLGREGVMAAPADAGPSPSVSRPIADPPPTYDAGDDALVVSRHLINAGGGAASEGFVVLDGDVYFGVGDALTLLTALAGQEDDRRCTLDAVRREVGAPLDGLLAVAALLQRQPLSLDGAAHLHGIIAAAQTALGVVAEITSDEVGIGPPPQISPDTLLSELMDEVDALWQVQAGLRNLRLITSRRAPPGLRVKVDAPRFKRVVDSLIEDALEGAPGGVVEVRLSADREGGGARIEVQVRDGRRLAAGSSLNGEEAGPVGAMSSAQSRRARIIEAMAGRLRYQRNDGAGLTAVFEVWLELADSDQTAGWTPDDSTDGALGHILIVDDNATNRLVAESLCQGFGFTSEAAENGPEAIEAVRLRGFDLVLMDIKMPGMDGMEATRAIRALGVPGEALPILALTANADPRAVKGCLAAGMCGVVEKPIKPEALFKAIALALNEAAAATRTAAAA